jgi:D-alanyl-D-alanine carboxypeptidase (penicillin-binding protein 5/6)
MFHTVCTLVARSALRRAALLFLLVLFGSTALAAPPADPFKGVARAYLVRSGGEDLWQLNAEQQLPPASLTKLMTALLILEDYRPDAVVTVSKAAAAEIGSRIGLQAGEKLTVADLLAATLIRSANDACHALADWHSGSEAAFAIKMTERAKALGMHNTQFLNACGLDKPGHLSTARDLAILAETALQNPDLMRIVNKQRMVIRSVDRKRTFDLRSTNHLIGQYDGVKGMKTGFTNRAGPCLIAVAERDGKQVLLVLLNSVNRWQRAPLIFDQAFARLEQKSALVARSEQ